MLDGFAKLVEQRIQAAQKNGDFDNLEGAGKPINFEDDSGIPEDLRMAYKMLKNADCVPPEIELKKQILRTEDLLDSMQDSREKYKAVKKLNYLVMKLNCLRRTPVNFEEPQYAGQLIDRLTNP